jgi:Ring finger domain
MSRNPNIVIQDRPQNWDWAPHNDLPATFASAWNTFIQGPISTRHYEVKLESEKHNGEEIDCSLCLETIENESSVYKLPCGHEFHSHKCMNDKNIIDWIQDHGTCPYCRSRSAVHHE